MKNQLDYKDYIKLLTAEQKRTLCQYINISVAYLYHYKNGFRNPTIKRISKIIEWANKNTPDNIPTFDELISLKNTDNGAV